MNNDNLSNVNYVNNEIDLKQIVKSLKEKSRFIFGFTGVVTLVAIAYILYPSSLPLQYKVETSFLQPRDTVTLKLNKFKLFNETKDSL